MDPRTENSNTNQKQEQPSSSSSNSSVPPLSNVASTSQQLQGHGVKYDDTDDYHLGLLPKYDSTIVISEVTDDDDQRNENPMPSYIVSNESETETESDDDDDDDDDGNIQFYNGGANRYASFIHSIQQIDDDDDSSEDDGVLHEIDDGYPTPFSKTIKAIKERISKTKKMGFVDESLVWVPKRNGEDLVNRRFCVPSLKELSLKCLANHADSMVSLDGIPDEFKQRLCALLCDSRKMNARFLQLLLSGSPTHVRLKDCSWLTQEEFTAYFGELDTSMLEVLQLDRCGRVINEDTLLSTLAKSANCLSRLISLSLTGACRLMDKGLQLLVYSAPALRSINLSQCSLLTYASLDILADSLGSILNELYLDDCVLIDADLILSGLKRLEQLEVLSLAGVQNVSDKFIESYIIACGHNIKELVLKDCINLTDASMKVIAEYCPGLHALDLMNLCKLTDLTIGYLANSCRELRKLKFCRNPFSGIAIAAFLQITGKSLEELSLNNLKRVGQQTALSLSNNAKNLHTLDLSGCRNLTDNEFGLIVDRCLSLRSLKLFGCSQVTDVFLKRHSNLEIQIFGLNLCPILQHIKEPDPHRSVLRYSSV